MPLAVGRVDGRRRYIGVQVMLMLFVQPVVLMMLVMVVPIAVIVIGGFGRGDLQLRV